MTVERNIDRLHRMSIQDTNECIVWDGSFYPNGYGTLRKGNSMVIAHRETFLKSNNFLPKVVMHTCDNRACINIRHLKAGDTQMNVDDKVAKGRHLFGSKVGNSELNENDVLQIRNVHSSKLQREIAELFGVSQTLISQILRRKIWKHI